MDGIEKDLSGRAQVVRLNVQDDAGREIAWRYGLTAVPTFLVFHSAEEPVARFVGRPDHNQILNSLLGP